MTQHVFDRQRTHYFPLGRIVVDRKSAKKVPHGDLIPALARHISGDWGTVNKLRRRANQMALSRNRPLSSVYFSTDGVRFRVTTNAERSLTSVQVF